MAEPTDCMDQKRQSMLMRRGSSDDAEQMRKAIFEGRVLQLHPENAVSNPSSLPDEASDPHRLFQLLRRRKKTPHAMSVPTPLSAQPATAPAPPCPPEAPVVCSSARGLSQDATATRESPSAVRPVFSARPFSPADRPPTQSGREVHSAQPNGRPFTRQKHPKKSLDLFPSSMAPLPTDPFPKPQVMRKSSGLKQSASPAGSAQPTRSTAGAASRGAVNFNCLFFKSEDELDGNVEPFPQHRPANIPLIETDWFSATTWEQLPTSDGAPQHHDEDLGPDTEEQIGTAQYAESLYELLVASKRRPLAR